MFLLVGTRI